MHESLIKRVKTIEDKISQQESGNTLPLKLDQALTGRGYVKNSAAVTALTKALPGTNIFYVSSTSGGSPTVKLTFINGILTADT
jgi:hypothetical protein